MSTKLTLAGVLNAHSKELNEKIIVAKATEATHRGKGRLRKEGRAKVHNSVSKEVAKARKRKAKKKNEERERSKERAQTRKTSTSCKERFLAGNVLEAQGGVMDLLGMDLGPIIGAVGELADEVSGVGESADGIKDALRGLSSFANKFDHKNLNKIGDSLEGLDDKVKTTIVPLASKLVDLLEKLEKRTDPSAVKTKIKEMFPSDDIKAVTITAALVLASIYAMYTENVLLTGIITGLSVLRAIMTGHGVFHAAFTTTLLALNAIKDNVKVPETKEEIELQGGFEKPLYAVGTVALVCSIFGIGWKHSDELYEMANKISMPLSRFDSVKKGWRSFVDSCLSGLQAIIDFLSKLTGKEGFKVKSDPYFFLQQYILRVHNLRDQFMSGIRDQSVLHQCNELYAEAEKVINELRSTGGTDLQIRDVAECKKVLNNIMTSLGSMNIYSSGQRTAPVTILLTGAPGVGKTTLMNWAWPVVAARILPKEKLADFRKNRGNYMYAYNQADKFYSGYRGQQHMLIDEFGFTRDSATGESVFSELIMMNNNNPYVLNMAALEDKGRYHFRSEMLWLTTNRESFRPDQMPSVQEPEAVLRRLEFAWCVCVKREWSTEATRDELPQHRRLDKAKMRAHLLNRQPKDELFPHIELHKMTSVRNGKVENKGMSVDAFIDVVVDQYEANNQEGADMLKMVQESVDEIINERMASTDDESYADQVLEDLLSSDIDERVGAKIEKQAGESYQTRMQDCVCACCTKIPFRATFDNFVRGINNKKRFDGNKVIILDPECRDKAITREEFDSMFTKRLGEHMSKGFAELQPPKAFYDRCISLEARESASEAALLFLDTMFSNRFRIGNMDFGNRNYLASKMWLATMWLNIAGQILASFGFTIAVMRVVSHLFTPSTPAPADDPIEVVQRTNTPEAVYTLRRPIVRQKKNSVQLGIRGVEDVMKSVVRSNCYRVDCINQKTGASSTGVVTMVRSQIALLPCHIMEAWVQTFNDAPESHLVFRQMMTNNGDVTKARPAGQNVYLKNLITATVENGKTINSLDFKQVGPEGDDSVIVFLPEVRRGKDIVKHFLSKSYHIPTGSHSYFYGIDPLEHTPVERTGMCSYTSNVAYEQYKSTHAIISSYTSKKGDCGTLVGVVSTPAPLAIYGIHVAGSPRSQPTAYAIRVCQEDLYEAMEELGKDCRILVDNVEECVPPATAEIVTQGGHRAPAGGEPLMHVQCIARPITTNLKHSPLFGRIGFECPTEPANLRMHNGVDALENASLKYNMYVKGIPPVYLQPASEIVGNLIQGVTKPKFDRVLTYEEAVKGIPGERFMGAMPRNTSPGLPWKMMWRNSGKQAAFGEDEEIDMTTPEMKKVIAECEWCLESMRNNIRPVYIFSSFLKDELRPKGKPARLISSAPLHLSILMRRYFMGFSEHIMSGRIKNGITVGINPMSDEWTMLGNRHKGQVAVSGDVSGFDCCLEPNLMATIKKHIHEFYCDYGTEDYHIREMLFDELIFSRHAYGNAVYEWTGCNPSGNFLTTILNSLANLTMAYSAILSIDHNYFSRNAWDGDDCTDVNVSSYGDDILISSYTGDFTFKRIRDTFAPWGIKFTDEEKREDGSNMKRDIYDVSFLKRGFLILPEYSSAKFIAPLAMETILSSIQWMRKTDHTFEDFINRVDTMLIELSAHGEAKYNYWQKIISVAAQESWVGPRIKVMAWRERFNLFLSLDNVY